MWVGGRESQAGCQTQCLPGMEGCWTDDERMYICAYTCVLVLLPPCRDLKARAESLGAQLSATASAAALEERALAAEGRAKALAASLGRKDAALREAQAAAAGLKAQLAEAQAAAAGGGPEVQASLARLRAELGRKEASVQVGA